MNLNRFLRWSALLLCLVVNGTIRSGTAGAAEIQASENNLALRKMARQSSTGFGGDAGRAVDGNRNGRYNENSVSHTAEEREPWWEVDLGQTEEVAEIRLWNRTDEHGDRLVNFVVLVSDRPMAGRSLADLLQDRGVWNRAHSGMAGEKTSIAVNTRGRFVRVQLRQKNYLALAEVEVLAPAHRAGLPPVASPAGALVNLALKKSARQSSTGFGGEAARAVDGERNGIFARGSVSHTTLEKEPWWEVDLGRTEEVVEVRLWNRTDEHGDRLANFHVFVSEWPFFSNSPEATRQIPAIWNGFSPGAVGESVRIKVGAKGRFVRVQLLGSNYLSLAEVEVLGAGEGPPPEASAVRPITVVRAPAAATPAANPPEVIAAEKLIPDVGMFRASAARQPAEAWRRYLTQGAFERLPALERRVFEGIPAEVGWSYFFHGAVHLVCAYQERTAVVVFYHPWSDNALITLWQRRQGRSLIVRAEMVPGDVIRHPAPARLDLPPAWLRQVDRIAPLLTVSMATGETLRAVAAMFPPEAAEQGNPVRSPTRDQLEAAIDDPARMELLGAVSAVRLRKCFDGLQRYATDPALAAGRELTAKIQDQLARGDFSALSGPAGETQPDTLALLLRLQSHLSGYSVVAFTATPEAMQVFLGHPGEPKYVLALWFDTPGGAPRLRRVDLLNHDQAVLLGDKLRALVTDATTGTSTP